MNSKIPPIQVLPRLSGILLLTLFGLIWTEPAGAAEYYVSPDGRDENSGTLQQPFATLVRARDVVRERIRQKPGEDVTVVLRGGTHRLGETLVLDGRDSRAVGHVTTFSAYPGEKPVVTSGVPIQGWRQLEAPVTGLPEAAEGHVWVADVPKLKTDGQPWRFRTLSDEGILLPRARTAGFRPLGEIFPLDLRRCSSLQYPEGRLRNWPNLGDVEVVIRPSYAWVLDILPLSSVDEATRTATTTRPGTYPLAAIGIEPDLVNCWVENVPEGLDAPGKWFVNTAEGRLYLWPTDAMLAAGRGSIPDNRITAPALVELVRVGGRLDADDKSPDQPVRGIAFKGITFTGGDRYVMRKDERGFQHKWSSVDQANALLRLRGAESCVVEGCEFMQSGACGVRLDLHCQNNRIEGNLIHHVGEHGIALCGYGPGTKDVNHNNEVTNNWIHNTGELIWHATGIYIAQSGSNHIAFNRIHDVPYIGIVLSGSRAFSRPPFALSEGGEAVNQTEIPAEKFDHWAKLAAEGKESWEEFYPYLHARNNLVEGNELFKCVQVIGDGNAIYVSGAGGGNVIQRNYVHDLVGEGLQTALRPDDQQKDTTFRDNIVWRCVFGAVQLKHSNIYENNIFACVLPRSPKGRVWGDWAYMQLCRGPMTGTLIQRNIFYSAEEFPAFYRELENTKLEECQADYNLFFCVGHRSWCRQYLQELQARGLEQHSLTADPLFADPQNGDFRLQPDSPAFKIGFKPIAMDKIGIQSAWREKFGLPPALPAKPGTL